VALAAYWQRCPYSGPKIGPELRRYVVRGNGIESVKSYGPLAVCAMQIMSQNQIRVETLEPLYVKIRCLPNSLGIVTEVAAFQ
jgi:hypothetical protein